MSGHNSSCTAATIRGPRVKSRPGETGEVRQQRIYDFENDRTCADYIGELSEDAKSYYLPVVMRSAADPDQIAAGAGIGYFRLIWNIGQGFGRAIVGGASTLTEGIAQTFRDRIELDAEVREVVQSKDHVVVRYTKGVVAHEVKARTAILATPAPITHTVGVNLPTDLREALSKVVYGPHVAGAFLTNETTPMPYDGTYGTARREQVLYRRAESGKPRPRPGNRSASRRQHDDVLTRQPGPAAVRRRRRDDHQDLCPGPR